MNQDYKHPFHNPNHATRVSETFFFQKFVDINNVDKIVSPKYEMLVTYFFDKNYFESLRLILSRTKIEKNDFAFF